MARTRTTTAGYRGAHRAHARPYPALYILVAFSSLGIHPIREVLHGFGGYLYGLKTRFGWDWYSIALFVTIYEDRKTRFETALIMLMALVSLTVVFTLIVLFSSDLAVVAILSALRSRPCSRRNTSFRRWFRLGRLQSPMKKNRCII